MKSYLPYEIIVVKLSHEIIVVKLSHEIIVVKLSHEIIVVKLSHEDIFVIWYHCGHIVTWNHCYCTTLSQEMKSFILVTMSNEIIVFLVMIRYLFVYLVNWTLVCNKQVPDYYDWNWNHLCYKCRPEPLYVSVATVGALKSDLCGEFCCRLSRWVPILQLLISVLHPMGRTGPLPRERPVPYGH